MTVAEFRQVATDINHSYDDMDMLLFLTDKSISYIDKLHTIYGHVGSVVPTLFETDVKNILNIDVKSISM